MPSSLEKREAPVRIIVLTVLYATAVAVAVAFSPASGYIHPERLAETVSALR